MLRQVLDRSRSVGSYGIVHGDVLLLTQKTAPTSDAFSSLPCAGGGGGVEGGGRGGGWWEPQCPKPDASGIGEGGAGDLILDSVLDGVLVKVQGNLPLLVFCFSFFFVLDNAHWSKHPSPPPHPSLSRESAIASERAPARTHARARPLSPSLSLSFCVVVSPQAVPYNVCIVVDTFHRTCSL